jgi:hypothetical protein
MVQQNNLEDKVYSLCERSGSLMTLSTMYFKGSIWHCDYHAYNHYFNTPLQLLIPFSNLKDLYPSKDKEELLLSISGDYNE